MYPIVSVVLPDPGWILERLIYEIKSRLPYVRTSEGTDQKALINYYVTFAQWQYRVSPIEVAYFTHIENTDNEKQKFFSVAENVDYCICHAEIYRDILLKHGVKNVSAINPGVDLNIFRPKLQIGVVGRTYKSGRKGENIVSQLMDIDWIDWHFTGDGWPGNALHLTNEELPDFYRKMDYILVPSLYEGGPMCVAEALACGTEVIAPPVGWVPQFEHIEYKTGDVESLRNVLGKLFIKKKERAEKIEHLTWDAWAEGHDRIFQKLAQDHGVHLGQCTKRATGEKIAILYHTDEKRLKGGPAVRVPEIARLLNTWTDYDTVLCPRHTPIPNGVALAHVFALTRGSGDACIGTVAKKNIPCVLSPIFIEPIIPIYLNEIRTIFRTFYNEVDTERRLNISLEDLDKKIKNEDIVKKLPDDEYIRIQKIYDHVNHCIFLSQCEKKITKEYGFTIGDYTIIHNPVNHLTYKSADPDLFKQKYKLSDYILCVGRIDFRKNQLLLAYAIKELNLPLILIGHNPDQECMDFIKKYGGENVHIIGRLPNNSPLLASAYAGCRVYCLPSWAEGAALANLEAAASGCNMVLSNRSSETEYFGEFARYCNPGNIDSIRNTIIKAWDNPLTLEQKKEQQKFIADNYSWDEHIKRTSEIYKQVLSIKKHIVSYDNISHKSTSDLYLDLSRIINWHDHPVGLTRIEFELAKELNETYPGKVFFIYWNNKDNNFKLLPQLMLSGKNFSDFQRCAESYILNSFNLPCSIKGFLLSVGNYWVENKEYIYGIMELIATGKINLVTFIHDITPLRLPYWHSNYKEFKDNFEKIIDLSVCLLVNSDYTASDVEKWCIENDVSCPSVCVIRPGISFETGSPINEKILKKLINSLDGDTKFILYVSGIENHKNHSLLIQIWRRFLYEGANNTIPHLMCIGIKGSFSSMLNKFIREDSLIGKYVHTFDNLGDGELEWLYRNCLFTVYPSLYEGWGLPVSESLAFGKVCIASNVTSIPEIAPDLVDLIDPLDAPAWYKKIKTYCDNPLLLAQRESQIAKNMQISWKDSVCTLTENLQRLNWQIFEPPLLSDVSSIKNDEILIYRKIFTSGWRNPANNKIWSKGLISSLHFRIHVDNQPILLLLCMRSYEPERYIDIVINNKVTQTIYIENRMWIEQNIYIPPQPTDARGISNLHIEICKNKNDKDTPVLGLCLQSLEFHRDELKTKYFNKIIELFSGFSQDIATALPTVLLKRPDLRMMINNSNAMIRLLLWIWNNGIYEEPLLHANQINVKNIFKTLNTTIISPETGYTLLHNLLWRIRPDLRHLLPKTSKGQKAIVEWFNYSGIKEFGLNDII